MALLGAVAVHGNAVHELIPAVEVGHWPDVVDPLLAARDERDVDPVDEYPGPQAEVLPEVEGHHVVSLLVPRADDPEEPEEHARVLHGPDGHLARELVAAREVSEDVLPQGLVD
eukprot:CAMPEP_0168401408 /NCGR_PEP_ID=MMETSP0228-20121227/23094_1 /TAXON_ID=133427 /ORGANISM="Protoceratium reticulatum, Strain CCCM 535 (=CCMP 1889)" /LENGTH=113 /DNA_ID=CAMNT_0008414971 /DNA_START=278 /DNA_END=619 /DNA_ORIENTATION=+